MLPIDAAAHSSRWRRRHPAEKALLGFGLTLCAVGLPPWPGAVLVAAATLTVLLGPAGVPGRALWRAFRIPLGFCVTGAIPLLFEVGGSRGSSLSRRTVRRTRASCCCGPLRPRSGCCSSRSRRRCPTSFPGWYGWGSPAPVVDVALVMYRIIFLLLDAMSKIRQAQAARLGHTTRAATWRSLAGLGATTFVRAFDRAQRLQSGLAGRGYDGTLRVLVPGCALSRPFLAATGVLLTGLVALTLVLERLLP